MSKINLAKARYEFDLNSLAPHIKKLPVAPSRHRLGLPQLLLILAHSPKCVKFNRTTKTLPTKMIFILNWLCYDSFHWGPISNCVLVQDWCLSYKRRSSLIVVATYSLALKTGLSGYSFQTAEAQFQTAYSIKTAVPLVVATYSVAL